MWCSGYIILLKIYAGALWNLLKNHDFWSQKLYFLNFGCSICIFLQKSRALTPSRQRVSLFAWPQSSPPWNGPPASRELWGKHHEHYPYCTLVQTSTNPWNSMKNCWLWSPVTFWVLGIRWHSLYLRTLAPRALSNEKNRFCVSPS